MSHKNNLHPVKFEIDRFFGHITRRLRPHKTIAVGFVALLLIISTQLWVACMKDDKSTDYLKIVGSCNQPANIKIYDETGGVDPAAFKNLDGLVPTYSSKPVNIIENKHFKNYVTTISKYVFAKVDAMSQCQANSGKPQVELVFVYRPAISSGIATFNDFRTKSHGTKQLDSPWVKLTLNKSSTLNLRAVFLWNERQFLLDQALIFGAHNWDKKQPTPIALKIFDDWERNYASVSPSQKADLAQKLPIDIQWLFKNARISDCRKFITREAMCGLKETTIEREKIGYIELNEALIDRLFASAKTEIRCESVLDLKDIFNIAKYQIESFTKEE